MNSFMIFSQEQRSNVRRQHPNLDNRAVSKLLGDMWTKLSEDEKRIYFYRANQVFVWYLLVWYSLHILQYNINGKSCIGCQDGFQSTSPQTASPWVSWSMGSLGSLVRSSTLVLLGDQPHSPCMVHGVEGSHDAPTPCRGTCSARDPDLIQTQNRIQSMWAEHKWSGNWSRACQNCYWSYLFLFY